MANNTPPLPPPWPVNYSFVALHNYASQPTSEVGIETLSIARGDLGGIIDRHVAPNGKRWVRVSIPHEDVKGWVPRDALAIGTSRPTSSYIVNVNLPQATNIAIPPPPPGTQDQLFRTIYAITETWAAGRDSMELSRIDTSAKRARLNKEIYQAYGAAGLVPTLNKPKFTLPYIIDAAVKVTSQN